MPASGHRQASSHVAPRLAEVCMVAVCCGRLEADLYDKVRMASEVHRQVRCYAQSFIEPGIKLIDMCERLENKNRELMQVRPLVLRR